MAIQDSAPANMITLQFDPHGFNWMTLRASGTEPKIKFYAEMRSKWEERENGRKELQMVVERVCEWLLEPQLNGLVLQIQREDSE